MDWKKKDQQVAQALRGLIASGEWVGQLPGYRKLEKRLQVNRSTIERAMELLAGEGILAAAEIGKRRMILHADCAEMREPAASPILLVVAERPLHDFSPTHRATLARSMQIAESEGWKVVYESFDFGFPHKSVTQMRRLVADYQPSRVLLFSCSAELAQWAAQGEVPSFLLGGAITGLEDKLNGVGVAFSRLVCDAAACLRALGHRHLLIPMVSGKTAMRQVSIDASAASWASDIPRVELEAIFAEQGEWLPDVLREFWPRAFSRLKPTAVLVKETHEYLSLLSYCQRSGLRIPQDLSVIQLVSDATCGWLDPVPDRFEVPVEKMCRKVQRWLQLADVRPQGHETIRATYLPGGTIAKARAE